MNFNFLSWNSNFNKLNTLLICKKNWLNIFFFEQNVNTLSLVWSQKWLNSFLILAENFFFEFNFKKIFFCNELILDEIFFEKKIDTSLTIEYPSLLNNKILKYLSSTNIYLSSDDSVDAYFYNELVVKYNYIPKNVLIEKYNLPSDFFSKQLELETQITWDLWSKIPYQNDWIYDTDNLYVSDVIVPFYTNQYLIDLINSLLYEYNPIDWYLGWELKSYYHYEVFFFLRDIWYQPMFDYWMSIFVRYRTIFFEDIIFQDPYWLTHQKDEHPFPLYSLFSHPWETIYAWEKFKGMSDYLADYFNFKFIELYDDLLLHIFDKKFVYLWHYIWGGHYHFDYMYQYGMLNWFQVLKSQLCNPTNNFPSDFLNIRNVYNTAYEWSIHLSLYPELLVPKGWITMYLDYWTADYNWFFHAGFTYLDSMSLLEIFWYQCANVVWGDFDSFTEDYMAYQSMYVLDQSGALRTALIQLILKNPSTKWYYELFIWNYNSVFFFTQNPVFKWWLKADILYPLTKLQKLALFWDEIPVEYWLHHSEWLACLFYGYNVSFFINNHPRWYADLWHCTLLYEELGYDSENDEKWEEYEQRLLYAYNNPLFKNYYDENKYFKYLKYFDYITYFDTNFMMKYMNEKFYDDIGFFLTSLMWGEPEINWSPLLNFNGFIIKYSDIIPYFHDTWIQFYWIFKFFDLLYLFYDKGLDLPFMATFWDDFNKWWNETFEFGWKETLVREAFFWKKNGINFAASCPWYVVLYFSIRLDKIFGLFFDLKPILNSKIFFFLQYFFKKQQSFFELISTETFINCLINIKMLLTTEYFVIKICNEPIQSYFDFCFEIYKSTLFQMFFNFLFKNILVWEKPLISVSKLNFENYPFKASILNYVDTNERPLALEFYVPFLIWPITDYVIKDPHPTQLPFNIKLTDYFFVEKLSFDEYLEKFVLIILLNELIKEEGQLNNDDLYNILCLLHELELPDIWFEGFDRYLNYVMKWKLYYSYTYKPVQLIDNSELELKKLNEIANMELEVYWKLDVSISTKNLYNYNEEFFNMCTDDLKIVLNYWARWNLYNS